MKKTIVNLALIGALATATNIALADSDDSTSSSCKGLPDHAALQSALIAAYGKSNDPDNNKFNGGFGLNMWGTVVNRDGIVCAVAFTGAERGDQWPGSRVISAQKANTANAFSLPKLALSTANLYTAVQPGGSLFGLQESNPVNTVAAYKGPSKNYGQPNDPLVGHKIGGVNVFGGGLALYDASKNLVGAIGVSGDSSCADHNIAWRTRQALNLDSIPGGVGPNKTDGIDYNKASIWAHPLCAGTENTVAKTIGAGQ